MANPLPYWAHEIDDLLIAMRTSTSGLSEAERRQRLVQVGPNRIQARRPSPQGGDD